jgi:hypothetical protein
MFQIPAPMLLAAQQQAQQQQFQPYQGSQAAPPPNPMQAQAQGGSTNPLMQMAQQKGMQKLLGNPMGAQPQQNPMQAPIDPAGKIIWDKQVPGLNAPLPNTQAAQESPFAGGPPAAGAVGMGGGNVFPQWLQGLFR